MKIIQTLLSKLSSLAYKISNRFIAGFLCLTGSLFAYAGDPVQGEDVAKLLISGSIGKTLGKSGLIWTLLIAAAFAVATFYAVVKSDPKAFIPAFIIMAIVSTVTGVVLTF